MRRPPKYCHGFIDRHGKPRWYFRRPGFKRVPLPGLPWSREFMAAYEQALAGQPEPIGAARVKPGSFTILDCRREDVLRLSGAWVEHTLA
jgi:hypothetical protein